MKAEPFFTIIYYIPLRIGDGAVVLHPLSILLPMNKGHTKWDFGILNCFPESARSMVKGICDKEKLCLRFCSSVMANRCYGMYTYRKIYISIGLDRFSFIKVFVHELAHHEMYKMYFKGDVSSMPKAHGKEFRNMFRSLIEPYLTEEIYPPDILVEYKKWVKRWGGIGWNSYPFGLIENYYVYRKLKDLPDGTHFKTRGCGYIKVKHDEASGKYLCFADYGWVYYDANETVELI